MVDETDGKIEPIFPNPGLPVAFADMVRSFTHNNQVVKFYFSRFDPSVNGAGATETAEVAQVVMPIDGFIAMTLFFQDMLDDLTKKGIVHEDDIDRLKKQVENEK